MDSSPLDKKSFKKIPTTISEAVYQNIKQAIIEGKLKPNQRIHERGIAQLFSISTTPVREAFRRLAAENYLFINAQKDVVVASATEKEIKELFEVIRILDMSTTVIAMDNLSENDLKKLRSMTMKLDDLYQKNEYHAYLKVNMDIHSEIWKKSGNQFLYTTLNDLAQKVTIFLDQASLYKEGRMTDQASIYATKKDFFMKSHDEHLALLNAIEDKDKEKVREILYVHWWGEESKEDNVEAER